MAYEKRKFTGFKQVAKNAVSILSRPASFVEMATGRGAISPLLREKIMLAVTSVNRCRYCAFAHSRIAQREGLDQEEIDRLLAGSFEGCDEDERLALEYAVHWAETGGEPDAARRQELLDNFGAETADGIEAALRAIMFGNYFGNTVDWALHTVSGGKLASEE